MTPCFFSGPNGHLHNNPLKIYHRIFCGNSTTSHQNLLKLISLLILSNLKRSDISYFSVSFRFPQYSIPFIPSLNRREKKKGRARKHRRHACFDTDSHSRTKDTKRHLLIIFFACTTGLSPFRADCFKFEILNENDLSA